MSASLVGSEMCIRDSQGAPPLGGEPAPPGPRQPPEDVRRRVERARGLLHHDGRFPLGHGGRAPEHLRVCRLLVRPPTSRGPQPLPGRQGRPCLQHPLGGPGRFD
eukprot:6154185-Alexandrium_andersonii.AAC.1